MRRDLPGWFAPTCVLLVAYAVTMTPARAQTAPPAGMKFFEKKVRPVLAEWCYHCHSTKTKHVKGGLRLDSRAALLQGGDSGPAVVPGQPGKSKLIQAVGYTDADLHMPPRGKLPAKAIADLTTWVEMGAPWPHEQAVAATSVPRAAFDLKLRKQSHWAWQHLHACQPPAVRNGRWPRDAVDRFILAALERQGLTPAPPADRRTWLRRVFFDLIGLPPSTAAIDAFVHDRSPEAYAKVVDRLLASPQFGERWGRHWLDLVRYADSRGHEFDYPTPNAYQYRDYVIRAFNADLPYNRFVTEQIAGDLLPHPRFHPTQSFNESIIGTGFWLLGEELHSPVDLRQDQADRTDNQIDVFSKTFLGLTVACARCHDHKFDAISSRDYYALYGVLESSGYCLARFDTHEHNREVARELWQFERQARPVLERAVADSLRPGIQHLAEMLVTATEAIRSDCPADAGDTRLQRLGHAHHLDVQVLARWVGYLRRAARDERDPFHAWTLAMESRSPRATTSAGRASLSISDTDTRPAGSAPSNVVVDYGKLAPGAWLTDGFNFGSGPVQPGAIQLGRDPAHPIVRVYDTSAAERDPTWDGLQLAPQTEIDPGVLGTLRRSGRSLSTPSFVINPGKVYYLVRGTGFAYAAVDGHSLINGPLHGQLIRRLNAGAAFRWIEHDLHPYVGQHTHIEFVPAQGADFAVAKVVQSTRPPSEYTRKHACLDQGHNSMALDRLALDYQSVFAQALDCLATDRLTVTPNAAGMSRLANWMIGHAELCGADAEHQRRLVDTAAPILSARAKILGRIRVRSRLALAMADVSAVDEHVFVRGSPKGLGPVAPRRFLQALAGTRPLSSPGSGRLELAQEVTDPGLDPLLPRVLVNRVWHHLFGRGIVGSVDNFGVLGDRPTHPELLDYLANQFVRDGWSIKRLVRRLVLSNTYRMSSRADPITDRRDPENRLLHRMRLRRLEGEAIRDAMLTVSGRLESRQFGPPIPIHLTPFQEGRGRPESGQLDGEGRRSVYLAVRRNFLSSFLLAFDTPIPFSTVGRRTVSNVPAQSLILMNDPFVHQQAQRWADRVLGQPGSERERIAAMYLSAFGRPPAADEMRFCCNFIEEQTKGWGTRAAWANLAHVLFNLKEFAYLP